ncbi:MAG TPA: hypothetical protein DDZ60_09575 [Planktothrix sp. UBA10369]|jgi:hypothetical protein|nr:hypothetical protein [Planktothrix sp. UBA10369]
MGVKYLSQKLIFSVIIIININLFVQTIAQISIMTQTIVNVSIPLTTIIEAISRLDLEAKHELYKLLEQQIQEAEANLSEVDIYDWGINGQPQGKPVEYIPGLGLAVIGGKDVPA